MAPNRSWEGVQGTSKREGEQPAAEPGRGSSGGCRGELWHQCVTGIQFSDAGMFALLARSLGYVVYIKFSI